MPEFPPAHPDATAPIPGATPASALPDGRVRRSDADGRPVEDLEFRHGRLNGVARIYSADGLAREAAFAEGLADGLATDFDRLGRPVAEAMWVAGRLHGPARQWRDGRLSAEMTFRDDLLDGQMTVYAPSGLVAALIPWRAGAIHGVMEVFSPDGRPVQRIAHVDGVRDGPTVTLDADGNETARVWWRAGVPVAPLPASDPADDAEVNPTRAFYSRLAREGRG